MFTFRGEKIESRDSIRADVYRNGGSIPPRLQHLSEVIKSLQVFTRNEPPEIIYTIVALSYRGFWTSKGRPSQKGIELDAKAALDWVATEYSPRSDRVTVILWGQSIGAGVALNAVAQVYRRQSLSKFHSNSLQIRGLLLETPFLSVEEVLLDLYPQRWLPYHYLGTFLRSHWDAVAALDVIASAKDLKKPKLMILQAGKDELVSRRHALNLEHHCTSQGFQVIRRIIDGAFHGEVMTKRAGRSLAVSFIQDVAKQQHTCPR